MADDDRAFDPMAATVGESDDRMGFDEVSSHLDAALGKLVPQPLARRAVVASVATDREVYRPGEPVDISIEFFNRLPAPVTLRTADRRIWTWAVDGHPEASREPRHYGEVPGELAFRPRERKRVVRRWDGLLKSADKREWTEPARGEHEVSAYVAVGRGPRPEASTTIRIE